MRPTSFAYIGNVLSFYFPEILDHLQLSDEVSRRNGILFLPELQAHLIMPMGDLSACLLSGKRVFVIKLSYMSTEEEQYLTRGPTDNITAHQTNFNIEITELEEPGRAYR